jgi:5'-methylthioadenosine phosphorylase
MALSTDYDCWHAGEQEVSVESVLAVIHGNISIAKKSIVGLAESFPPAGSCMCQQALDGAMLTAPDRIPDATRKKLELLAGRFFSA